MRHRHGLAWGWIGVALSLVVWSGCKKAGMFGPRAGKKGASETKPADEDSSKENETGRKKKKSPPEKKKLPPLNWRLAWMPPVKELLEDEVPIHFVHQNSDEWKQLDKFWTVVEKPEPPDFWSLLRGPAPTLSFWALLREGGFPAGAVRREVKIKIPLGLDYPGRNLFPTVNPPTVGKWRLGKELFFEKENFLYPKNAGDFYPSCASCHKPDSSFSFGNPPAPDALRPPTLINVLYNTFQFWDGRVATLEEVVQRDLEDERVPRGSRAGERYAEATKHHRWLGVVQRLLKNRHYRQRFQKVFGTPPTQDAVGKALAIYLRTILAGDSLHDRVTGPLKGKAPTAAAYEGQLDKATLISLGREKDTKDKGEIARELALGYRLFFGKGRCVQCHTGSNFTDNYFHNIGVSGSKPNLTERKNLGRFAALPPGMKNRRYIGAYKTPTLRSVSKTSPYFHNGLPITAAGDDPLLQAVMFHVKDYQFNLYLDPELRDEKDPDRKRDLNINEKEARALALFLRSLDGTVAKVVADPDEDPE
jgi:cytochrome c peroxidase